MIVVVGLVGAVIMAVPGLPAMAVHVPVSMAAMVAEPPGSIAHVTVWSDPAGGINGATVIVVSILNIQGFAPYVVIEALYVPDCVTVID